MNYAQETHKTWLATCPTSDGNFKTSNKKSVMKKERLFTLFDMIAEDQEKQDTSEVAAVVEERPTIKNAFSDQQLSGKKKMDNNKINELFGIKESFELPERLITVLLDKEQREAIFNEFMKYDFDFSHDCLRDYFQDEHAARSALKQDYTPDCICDLISLLMPETDKIIDICSGTGALTIGTGRNVYFQCEEFSKTSISVLLFNLAIRGVNALVLQKDVLTKEVKSAFKVQNHGQYSDIEIVEDYEEIKTNVVISNPPYSLKWQPKQDERFAGYPLAPKSAADYAFVLDGLSRLTDNGTALYILPHGVLFRGKAEGEIRKQLVENNIIDAVIGLPDNTFLNTSIPVFILVLKKNRQRKDILFIDASREFEKKGKQNILTAEHLEKIADTYWNRKTVEKYSNVVTLDEIRRNDYNLNIPRFVDTYEPEPIQPLEDIIKDIINTRLEMHKVEKELVAMLSELQGDKVYNETKDDFIKYMTEQDIIGETMAEWAYLQNLEYFTTQVAAKANKVYIPILELCDFERAKKGKVYKTGTVYIQLSATDGQVRYLTEDKELEEKYGVFVPKSDRVPSRYLFYALEYEMPHFLARYQAGMNINPDIFKDLKINYFTDEAVGGKVAAMLDNLEYSYKNEEKEKDGWKEFKKFHLDGMFP